MIISCLSYGAIGLGLALALLSYKLLRNEQSILLPRPAIIRAIYVFMIFTFLLCLAGFSFEIINQNKEIIKLVSNAAELNKSIDSMKNHVLSLEAIIRKLDKMKHGIDLLTNIKGDRLNKLDASVDYSSQFQSIKRDLTVINDAIRRELLTD